MASPSISRLLLLPSSLRSLAWRQATVRCHVSSGSPLYSASRSYTSSTESARSSSSIDTPSSTTAAPNSSAPRPQSSVNSAEVTHFTTLASSWWDPEGSSRLLHLMNPLRHDFIRRCTDLDNTAPEAAGRRPRSYLDVGCGGGIFAESAARLPGTERVTAIDPTPGVLAIARRHARQDPVLQQPGRLEYVEAAIEDVPLPAPGAGYDVLTVFEVLEHVQRPAPFLDACLRHVRPGGWLVGSTIARTAASWLTTKLVAEDLLRIVPRGTHEWSQYIQPTELQAWARASDQLVAHGAGWQVMGVVYVPGFGWKEVDGSEEWGNYFFAVKKRDDA